MSQTGLVEFAVEVEQEQSARLRIADLLSKGIFGSLVLLVVVTAIPYGTFEAWWKAIFVCAVIAIGICAISESLLSASNWIRGSAIVLPMLALSLVAFIQTISFHRGTADTRAGDQSSWNAISADPYQTWFFILQLLALTVCLALLYRYASSEKRIRVLIYVIIGVAVVSALFGILRQTTQHEAGFVLPLLKPGQGYGQFLNKNHFAFLMEMALGLGLGMILGRGVKRDRAIIYVALLFPIWTGLVLSNSRGGILAMLSQVTLAGLILMDFNSFRDHYSSPSAARNMRRTAGLRVALLIILLVGIIVGTLWVGGDQLVSNFEAVSSEFNPDATGTNEGASRNEIWRATWRMFAAHPLLGVGLGGYWVSITAFHDASGTLTPREAHNDYLELLSSGRLAGFAIGVWFAVHVFRKARANLRAESRFQRAVCLGAGLGIAGVAVHSLVDFGLHMTVNALVFMALIMMATAEVGPGGDARVT